MEKMPFRPSGGPIVSTRPAEPTVDPNDWRTGLPTLTGSLVTLRELRASDAPALHVALTTDEVSRFISPPPTTVEGFERFIAWTQRQRATGEYVCFAVVPLNSDTAVGLFHVRSLEPRFATAEWGFVLASDYWGTGMFVDAARLTLDFVFAAIGARRLEARAAVLNGRGTAALRKMGAVHECDLRRSLLRHGQYYDQALWTILVEEWHETMSWGTRVIH
jgi:RimJ/RimL family protein N-acetyltransferase